MPNCKNCSQQFEIDQKDKDFYLKVQSPEPTLCPACRCQRRLAWRNERSLYQRKCNICKKSIIAMYEAGSLYNIICNDCFWSDKWEAIEHGQDFDFHRPFFEQFKEVQLKSPRIALSNMNSENSEFTNMAADNRNCYLLFAAENNENCMYGKLVQTCKECFDCNFIYDSELCYECINIFNSYNCFYCKDIQNSRECYFSVDLKGCSNCFLCSNLRNAEYYFENKKYSKQEYEDKIKQYLPLVSSKVKELKVEFQKVIDNSIARDITQIKSENCTGDYLKACRRTYDSFDATDCQDCRYLNDALEAKDTYDSCFIYYKPELCYETMSTLKLYDVQFSVYTYNGSNMQYCDTVHNSDNNFGCSGMKKQQFCILNKKYSEQEYKKLREKIIEHMKKTGEYGEMFPMSLSPFEYQETVAQEYFPKTEQNKIQKYKGTDGITSDTLPDSIEEVQDDVLEKIIICERSGRGFKIQKGELAFYKNQKLPLPHLHPEERHQDRMKQRNPRKLWDRKCDKCQADIKTTISEDRKEKVYCEKCYLMLI